MKKVFILILGLFLGIIAGIIACNVNWEYFSPLKCLDGSRPDPNGCCAGEVYTDLGEAGFNCCPESGGNCFPPIVR